MSLCNYSTLNFTKFSSNNKIDVYISRIPKYRLNYLLTQIESVPMYVISYKINTVNNGIFDVYIYIFIKSQTKVFCEHSSFL